MARVSVLVYYGINDDNASFVRVPFSPNSTLEQFDRFARRTMSWHIHLQKQDYDLKAADPVIYHVQSGGLGLEMEDQNFWPDDLCSEHFNLFGTDPQFALFYRCKQTQQFDFSDHLTSSLHLEDFWSQEPVLEAAIDRTFTLPSTLVAKEDRDFSECSDIISFLATRAVNDIPENLVLLNREDQLLACARIFSSTSPTLVLANQHWGAGKTTIGRHLGKASEFLSRSHTYFGPRQTEYFQAVHIMVDIQFQSAPFQSTLAECLHHIIWKSIILSPWFPFNGNGNERRNYVENSGHWDYWKRLHGPTIAHLLEKIQQIIQYPILLHIDEIGVVESADWDRFFDSTANGEVKTVDKYLRVFELLRDSLQVQKTFIFVSGRSRTLQAFGSGCSTSTSQMTIDLRYHCLTLRPLEEDHLLLLLEKQQLSDGQTLLASRLSLDVRTDRKRCVLLCHFLFVLTGGVPRLVGTALRHLYLSGMSFGAAVLNDVELEERLFSSQSGLFLIEAIARTVGGAWNAFLHGTASLNASRLFLMAALTNTTVKADDVIMRSANTQVTYLEFAADLSSHVVVEHDRQMKIVLPYSTFVIYCKMLSLPCSRCYPVFKKCISSFRISVLVEVALMMQTPFILKTPSALQALQSFRFEKSSLFLLRYLQPIPQFAARLENLISIGNPKSLQSHNGEADAAVVGISVYEPLHVTLPDWESVQETVDQFHQTVASLHPDIPSDQRVLVLMCFHFYGVLAPFQGHPVSDPNLICKEMKVVVVSDEDMSQLLGSETAKHLKEFVHLAK